MVPDRNRTQATLVEGERSTTEPPPARVFFLHGEKGSNKITSIFVSQLSPGYMESFVVHWVAYDLFSFFDLKGFEGVHKCYLDETLHTIIDRLTDAGVRHSFIIKFEYFFFEFVASHLY